MRASTKLCGNRVFNVFSVDLEQRKTPPGNDSILPNSLKRSVIILLSLTHGNPSYIKSWIPEVKPFCYPLLFSIKTMGWNGLIPHKAWLGGMNLSSQMDILKQSFILTILSGKGRPLWLDHPPPPVRVCPILSDPLPPHLGHPFGMAPYQTPPRRLHR